MSPERATVALFLPSLVGGGAERVMLDIAGGLVERGFSVDLVLARAEGPYLDEVPGRVRLVDLGAARVIRSLPALIRYLRQERPYAMLAALNHANVVALIAVALARVRTRLVVSEHNTLSSWRAEGGWIKTRLVPALMRMLYRRADRIVAVSHGVARDLAAALRLPESRITVVYNPINVERAAQSARLPVEHPWLNDPGVPVILAVGSLTEQKDHRMLLRAFAEVLHERDARLVILGEGPLCSELEGEAERLGLSGKVDFPGFQSNPFAFMGRASVFVLSSRWEGMPTVLIQALACGARVVSTACPSGPDEILEDGKWGTLVPVGDEHALARAMLDTLDADEAPDVRQRARDFDLEKPLDAYEEVLALREH